MKKVTTLLVFMLTFIGMMQAQTEISEVSSLSNSKVYTITPSDNNRGTWTYNPSNPTMLYSTVVAGSTIDASDPNQQFVFIHPEGTTTYYLYNVGSGMFVNKSGNGTSLSCWPTSTVTFVASTGNFTTYPWVVALDGSHVGISNSYTGQGGVITNYNSTADGGNCIKIIERGDFEAAAMATALARAQAEHKAERNNLYATIKNAESYVQNNKFNTNVATVKSAIAAAKVVLDKADATAAELTAQVAALSSAMYTPIANISSSQRYYLKQALSGRCLTVVTDGAAEGIKIKSMSADLQDKQLFILEPVADVENGFTIKNASTGKYLKATGGWNFLTGETAFTFVASDPNGNAALMFARTDKTDDNKYFGPNYGVSGEDSPIYSNHPIGDGASSQWYLELYDENVAANIAAAQAKYNAARAIAENDAFTLFQLKGLQKDATYYSSNYQSSEEGSLEALIDGNTGSYYHSQYGSATSDAYHHLQIQADLSDQTAVRFISRKRADNSFNRPTTILVQGSVDGTTFDDIETLTGLPSTKDDTTDPYYYSPALNVAGKGFQYIRFVVRNTNNGAADASGHPFFTYSEFYLVPDGAAVAANADILNTNYLDDDLDAKVEAVNNARSEILGVVSYNTLKTTVPTAQPYTTLTGPGLGQYTDATGNFLAAYQAAAAVVDSDYNEATDYVTLLNNLNAALEGLSINLPAAGKFYRMRVVSQSSGADNYLSGYGNGAYLNTKVTTSDAPTIFYYGEDGTLQIYYNLSYIKSGTANMGHTETTFTYDEADTWTFASNDFLPGTYKVKNSANRYLYDWTSYSRANVLVANDPNQARCCWTIEEVEMSISEIMTLMKTFDYSLIQPYQGLATIDLVEGAELTYPNEYTYTPSELNTAITAVNEVTADTPFFTLAGFLNTTASTTLSTVQHYKNLCDQYGAALSTVCTLKDRFSTLILPVNFSFPANWSLYTCAEVTDNVLTLASFSGSGKNTPLIVEYTDEASMPTAEAPKTYQFIGYSNGAATTNQTQGCLTGVLDAAHTLVPAGSYVLARHNSGVQGFFPTNGTVNCPLNKCYFTAPATTASQAFFFPGGTQTGIESVFSGNEGKVTIYNLAGQKLNKLEKGINIVNGRKVLVK